MVPVRPPIAPKPCSANSPEQRPSQVLEVYGKDIERAVKYPLERDIHPLGHNSKRNPVRLAKVVKRDLPAGEMVLAAIHGESAAVGLGLCWFIHRNMAP